MNRVTQTRIGKNGNCFNACIASILEVPLETVPEFSGEGEHWLVQLAGYLDRFGLYYVQVPKTDPIVKVMFAYGNTFSTIEGVSPNNIPHACVALNGKLVWDPDPRKVGLRTIETYGLLGARCDR